MRKKWIVAGTVALILIAAISLIIVLEKTNVKPPISLKACVGKNITLSQGMQFVDGISTEGFDDEFSSVYSEAVRINVENIDEEKLVATITVQVPPLRDILESCLPQDTSEDFDTLFDGYMDDVYASISACPYDKLVTNTVECDVVEKDGLKIVANNEFRAAVFPDVEQLLAELLMEMLAVREG